MKVKVDGMTAVITGAASGIGAEVVRVFAEAGARLALLDLDAGACRALCESLPNSDQHVVAACDVADVHSVTSAIETASGALGQLHALVNCAGIWRPSSDGPITKVTNETWDKIIAVNLTGTFNMCREMVRHMDQHGTGSIVTIGSVAGLVGWEKLNAYSASKAGVIGFSRALGIESAPRGIRVNCICPGVIETPMTSKVLQYSKPTVLPIGRLGRPEDIARCALFLSSEWASFIAATTIAVDGGFSAA